MIQRIQTIFLLIVSVISLSIVNLDIPYFNASSSDTEQVVAVDYNSTETGEGQVGKNTGLIYFFYACGILAFICIFLYKNRKLQMRLIFGCIILVLVIFMQMYWYSYQMNYFGDATISNLTPAAAVPISMLVFSLLAFIRVRKDEKLVRSLDRIR